MKTIFLLFFTIISITVHAGRLYSPDHGRFLNPDPISVEGGINIYNSVSNNMVNGFAGTFGFSRGMEFRLGNMAYSSGVDPYGFAEWKGGKRDGKQRATLIIKDGDTIQDVADFVRLDASEFKKWLDKKSLDTEVKTASKNKMKIRSLKIDEEIKCDTEVTIPNLVYAIRGPANTGLKGGKISLNPWSDKGLPANLALWAKLIEEAADYKRDMDKRGYLTKIIHDPSEAQVLRAFANKDLYGWGFFGHGNGGIILKDDVTVIAGFDTDQAFSYKLGFITLFACMGQDGNWGKYVSERGFLRAYDGCLLPLLNDWTDIPITNQ